MGPYQTCFLEPRAGIFLSPAGSIFPVYSMFLTIHKGAFLLHGARFWMSRAQIRFCKSSYKILLGSDGVSFGCSGTILELPGLTAVLQELLQDAPGLKRGAFLLHRVRFYGSRAPLRFSKVSYNGVGTHISIIKYLPTWTLCTTSRHLFFCLCQPFKKSV